MTRLVIELDADRGGDACLLLRVFVSVSPGLVVVHAVRPCTALTAAELEEVTVEALRVAGECEGDEPEEWTFKYDIAAHGASNERAA